MNIKPIGKIYSDIPGDDTSPIMDVIELEGEWYVGLDAFNYPESGAQLITFDIYNVPDDWKWMKGWEAVASPPPMRTRFAEVQPEKVNAQDDHTYQKFNVITGRPALDKIRDITSRHDLGRLGLNDTPYPYVIPMNHSLVGNELYLHGSFTGKKVALMNQAPEVCYEIDAPLAPGPKGLRSCHLEYESVLFFGTIREVTNSKERFKVLTTIMQQYGMPFKHGSEERCNAYVIHLHRASARTGRFRPRTKRDLYLYNWAKWSESTTDER